MGLLISTQGDSRKVGRLSGIIMIGVETHFRSRHTKAFAFLDRHFTVVEMFLCHKIVGVISSKKQA